jgi:hypothetical protein
MDVPSTGIHGLPRIGPRLAGLFKQPGLKTGDLVPFWDANLRQTNLSCTLQLELHLLNVS